MTRHVPRASAHRLGAAGWTVRRLAVQPRHPGKTPSTDAPSSHEPGGNSPARTASSPSQGRVTLPDDFPGKTVRAFPGARTHPALKSTMRKKNAHATTLCATLARHLWPRNARRARSYLDEEEVDVASGGSPPRRSRITIRSFLARPRRSRITIRSFLARDPAHPCLPVGLRPRTGAPVPLLRQSPYAP